MRVQIQEKKILVRSNKVFLGVDVPKESWHVTARTEGAGEVFNSIEP
jgi:hypothetical protein